MKFVEGSHGNEKNNDLWSNISGKNNQYYFSVVLTSRSGYNSHSVAVSKLFSKERFYLIWSEITIRLLFVSF